MSLLRQLPNEVIFAEIKSAWQKMLLSNFSSFWLEFKGLCVTLGYWNVLSINHHQSVLIHRRTGYMLPGEWVCSGYLKSIVVLMVKARATDTAWFSVPVKRDLQRNLTLFIDVWSWICGSCNGNLGSRAVFLKPTYFFFAFNSAWLGVLSQPLV